MIKRQFLLLIVTVLFLVSCSSSIPSGITGSTAPTEDFVTTAPTDTSTPPTPPDTTVAPSTLNITTTPPPSVSINISAPPVDPQTMAELTAKFSEWGSWYNMALTSCYASPSELNLRRFLGFGGFSDEDPAPTDYEWEQLKDRPFFSSESDFYRLPVSKINKVLTECFGITVAELSEDSFKGLQYLEDTDCYYYMTTGVDYIQNFAVLQTAKMDDETIRIYYSGPFDHLNPDNEIYVVTLIQVDSGYRIISNLPLSVSE